MLHKLLNESKKMENNAEKSASLAEQRAAQLLAASAGRNNKTTPEVSLAAKLDKQVGGKPVKSDPAQKKSNVVKEAADKVVDKIVEVSEELTRKAKVTKMLRDLGDSYKELSKANKKKLKALVINTPALDAVIQDKNSAITPAMILQIADNNGLDNFLSNLNNGFMASFGKGYVGIHQNYLPVLAQMDKDNYLKFRELFNPNLEKKIVLNKYVELLNSMGNEEAKIFINAEPKLLKMFFIDKSIGLPELFRIQAKLNEPAITQHAKNDIMSVLEKLPETRASLRAQLAAARERANKMNKWYYWNGKAKAKQINDAANLIEAKYFGENAELPPLNADDVFTVSSDNAVKSLTQALSTCRYGLFYGSRSKDTTASLKMFNAAKPQV